MSKKIIFMGTPFFSVPILKSLYQNGYPISVVYTQPPQKSNRGHKINKSPIQGISETLNIDFRSPITLKDNHKEYEFLKISDYEIKNKKVSYSFNTISYLNKNFSDSDLFFLLGSDSLLYLDKWYRIDDIFNLCNIVIYSRPEYDKVFDLFFHHL